MILHGIDVSKWQGRIVWPSVRAAGKDFAWIRATLGGTYVDECFVQNWAGAGDVGLRRGGYHYLTSSTSGEEQARHFLSVYTDDGELPPALDIEVIGEHQTGHQLVAEALRWLILVENELHVRPIIYTGPYFADTHFGPVPAASTLGTYRLWIAHYTEHDAPPRVPWPWTEWVAWQHSSAGRVAGIHGPVDLDCMRVEEG